MRPTRALVCAGALLILGGLASWASGFDLQLHPLLRVSAASIARVPALWLTMLGGLGTMGPFALVVVLGLVARGRRQAAIWLFATIASGRLVVEGLKLIVTRARPPRVDWLDPVASWSFPSSHSAGAMLTGMAIALLVGTRSAFAAAILFAGLVGWSRLALGVHWPGDVLAGWGFGLLWVGAANTLRPTTSGAALLDQPRSP